MSLTRIVLLAGLSTAMISTAASAESFREHFMSNWDLDGNGSVTLQEVQERRDSVFAAFDANDDGYLDAEEQAAMGDMRDTEHASMAEDGIERPQMGMGQGHGQGMGPGKGMGQGHGQGMGPGKGMGQGMGMGASFRMNAEAGMHDGRMIDSDSDGKLSHDEFVGMSQQWLARLDANGDGEVSQADF